MRRIKKVLGTVLLSAMVFSVAGNASVLANNWENKPFGFTFNGAQKYTDAEKKEDTSKLYMKCNSIAKNKSYTAHAIGCKTASSADRINCSRGYTYNFSAAGHYYYMTSWVKEDGYNYARIACNPNYALQFSASGVWSPDNINKY